MKSHGEDCVGAERRPLTPGVACCTNLRLGNDCCDLRARVETFVGSAKCFFPRWTDRSVVAVVVAAADVVGVDNVQPQPPSLDCNLPILEKDLGLRMNHR